MNKQMCLTTSHHYIPVLQRNWKSHITLLFPFDISRSLCYRQSCHNCFNLASFFKTVAAQTLLQCWKQMINLSLTNYPDIMKIGYKSLNYEIIAWPCKFIF